MSDNTVLNPGVGGDSVRDIDRSGVKTQIFSLDLNPAGAETLMAGLMPVSAADGADLAQGAKADSAATDSTSAWSAIALLKGIWARLAGTLTVTVTNAGFGVVGNVEVTNDVGNPLPVSVQTALPAGTNLIGSVLPKHGTKAFTTAAPTGTAAQCLAANTGRVKALIVNNGTQTVYLGVSSGVTASTGVPLAAGASLEDDASTDAWFAITATGTGDSRILEIS